MATYELNISFTNEQLEKIHLENTKVAIGKSSSDSNNPDTAWQVFSPLQENTISWESEYGI